MRIKYSYIKDFAGLILTIASVVIAWNMYSLVQQQTNMTLKQRLAEISHSQDLKRLNEAQLISGLLPSLINGSQKEKELAINLIDTVSETLAPMIMLLLSDDKADPQIRNLARNRGFDKQLQTALTLLYTIKRPDLANRFFLKAAKLADPSIYNPQKIAEATSLATLGGQDLLAAKKFSELFDPNHKP